MKQAEYIEGPEALKNFEQGMIALFKAPKTVEKAKKKGRKLTAPRKSEPKSDKG
jgi:exonuclease VII small subunit